jgi:hypothetical protein
MLSGTVVAGVGIAAVHEKLSADADVIIDDALAAQLSAGLAAF